MPRRLQFALALLAASAVYFVVVCPVTPTPTALCKGKQAPPAVLSLPSALAVLAALLPASASMAADEFTFPRTQHRIELTCIRLC